MSSKLTWMERFEDMDWSRYVDRDLLLALLGLIGLGVVMLASASLWVAEKRYGDAFHFLNRQLIFLAAGLVVAFLVYQIKVNFWQQLGVKLLPIVLLLLLLVLIPGIGVEVNGSRRWLNFGVINLQVSELVKLITLLYLSGYLIRHGKALTDPSSYKPLLIPLLVLAAIGGLLIAEPDFGWTVIIFMVGMALLLLGGVAWKHLTVLFVGAVVLMMPLAFVGYRSDRWDALLDPWKYAADQGYQTVGALMAVGDGGWFGSGLGAGVQKLFYLPEAHNDFIFAVLAEEFGFVGMLVVLALYGLLVFRAFVIGFQADKYGQHFGAYVAYGIGFWMGFQVILHIGVNLAVLPPKGLTLPLMSYGGSSLLVSLMAMAILMRVYRDTQIAQFGVSPREAKRRRRTTQAAIKRRTAS